MIYYLSQYLLKLSENTTWQDHVSFLRLFRYISFRSAGIAYSYCCLMK